MTNVLYTRGTADTVLSTELNSLANNALVAHATSVTVTSAGFMACQVELYVTYGTAPTVGTAVLVWFLREVDGTNFEDGSASITPLRAPDVYFPLRDVTTAQRIIMDIVLPPGNFKPLVKNNGTGQSMAASGNTLKIRPYTQSF